MTCLACSVPFSTFRQPQIGRGGINRENTFNEGVGTSGFHLDVVRPAQLHHHDGLVGMGGFPLRGHLPRPWRKIHQLRHCGRSGYHCLPTG